MPHVVALAGGVGGARLAFGLSRLLPADELTVIVNTADDDVFHGLHVSPDLDTVMYTLAGEVSPDQGWGRRDDTFTTLAALASLGADTWFRLGDRDLSVHIRRTELLREGHTLSEVTRELCSRFGVSHAIVPMSDHAVRTVVETDRGTMAFQDYFVRHHCEPRVKHLVIKGAERATPSPWAEFALERADAVVLCPSNPFLSIDPILSVPGIRKAVEGVPGPKVAVSPIIGGKAVRGPAGKLFEELSGTQASCGAVARHYAGLITHLMIDTTDRPFAPEVAAAGPAPVIGDILMRDDGDRVALAGAVLSILGK